MQLSFKEITRKETEDYIKNYHYLHRMPPLSFAYGAYDEDRLVGVLTFGKPPSNSLCEGICGKAYSKHVIELNRLYTLDETPKNTESQFISYGLRDLKKKGDFIIVSYADSGMGHNGYIYQATNWLYTGTNNERTDIYVGKEAHSKNYNDAQRGFVVRSVRSVKHRYVYFVGNKRFTKQAKKDMNYPIHDEYPKGDNSHYAIGDGFKKILKNKETKEVFTESEFFANPLHYITPEQFEDYKDIYSEDYEAHVK